MRNLNLYLPQNVNSVKNELDLIGIPTVHLQSLQSLTGLFFMIDTLSLPIMTCMMQKKRRIVKIFPMMCCHSGEIGIYSTTPKFQKLLSMANILMYIIDPQ